MITMGMKHVYASCRVFSVVVFSARAAGYAATFAPSYGGAQQAATRIFSIIDHRPHIDTMADRGDTYVSEDVVLANNCHMHS